jgi:hypothetical protein
MGVQKELFEVVPGRDDRRHHVFSVIVKRTYLFHTDGSTERCEHARPFRRTDSYYDHGDPTITTVEHEAELVPFKRSTDVVVIGSACAPNRHSVRQMLLSVQIGERRKTLRVSGDRHCVFRAGQLPVFTDPQPFTRMQVRYERAYGGRDDRSIPDIPFIYPRNDLGVGVVLRNVREVVDGLALPNIEDPDDLLTPDRLFLEDPQRWHLQPLPQGFGWRQRTWYPRCALLGSYPAFTSAGTVTREERMGLLPADHIALAKQLRLPPLEAHFGNGASYGMVFQRLNGDELIRLEGWTRDGPRSFSLPGEAPSIALDLGSGHQQLAPQLHTVSIRADDGEFDLIWRGALSFPGYHAVADIKRLDAQVY